jgi:3-oxoacyl-[acyl-carrier-protein] synthase-3
MIRSVVRGIGSALPRRIMRNIDFDGMVETSDEWIVQRTGIRQRHIASDEETTASLGEAAAREALANAGLTPDDLDMIVLATSTPNNTFPATAVDIQQRLGMRHGFAFDMQAVCSGFVYAVSTADLHIRGGLAKRVLVIGSETFSRILDWTDRSTCVLFGDGAGAVLLGCNRARGLSPIAACWQPACAPTACTGKNSMSTAVPRRRAPLGICAWKAVRSSSMRSA